MNIEEMFATWQVHPPGMWHNNDMRDNSNWYAVSNDDGIVAYFGNEADALGFRLYKINQLLNTRGSTDVTGVLP